ncbi:hypothetical protein GCM10007978_32170 [Shewanella hanedai]|uniref:DUF4331 domain-containing protein n=1 Tax=Shewanella hanedai TaxID=25 RepID=A0A553JKC3_SHEHA|nr:DUF4331 family protein [Shewanella hanedai]TRY12914.1 DUF4331 domain-containing protein [Shewanella hanedai]GGI92204.1 hypothetical protein GCM10007978_32170 [Shewanella hanedai]
MPIYINKLKIGLIASALVLLANITFQITPAFASHHFESELSIKYPQFDLTDMFVFESEKSGYTAFMMNINPTTGTDGSAAFGENGVYNFHIASDKAFKKAGMTITAYLDKDKLVFGIVDGANQAIGTKGKEFGRASIGKEVKFNNGIRVWSGAAHDTFVGNSEGIIGFMTQLLGEGQLTLSSFDKGVDLFKDFQSSVILVEIPNKMLPKEINVYASTAMYNVDQWVQVNRLAHPLMTHMFMVNNKMEISEHTQHRPDSDLSRAYAVSGTVLRAATLDKKQSNPVAYADSVAVKLLPDMIPYSVGTKAAYTFEEINGRKPSDDAMDAALSIFIGRKVTDNANTFNRHPKQFPYVKPIKK